MLLYTTRSDRKILNRVLKTDTNVPAIAVVLMKRNVLLGSRSPAARSGNPCERGDLVQVQDFDA